MIGFGAVVKPVCCKRAGARLALEGWFCVQNSSVGGGMDEVVRREAIDEQMPA